MGPRRTDPWSTPHPPRDTILPLLNGVEGVRSGVSRVPVDAADRVAGLRWAARAAGVSPDRVALLRQIHGVRVRTAPWKGFPEPVEGDGLVTLESDVALCVRIADCAPVALAAPGGGGVAMLHAGWRGLAEGVVEAGVDLLASETGTAALELSAAIGPAIGGCCYEVGTEFRDRFPHRYLRSAGDRLYFDLPAAVWGALEAAGLHPDRIQTHASACTVCASGAPDGVRFHSHRGSGGGPERNIAYILKAGPGGHD